MGRIQNYSKDTEVTANDKWVGSDFENYGSTKNFTPTSIAKYLNDNNVINIGSDLRYRYQTLDPGEVRNIGTLSFESEIGASVSFTFTAGTTYWLSVVSNNSTTALTALSQGVVYAFATTGAFSASTYGFLNSTYASIPSTLTTLIYQSGNIPMISIRKA